MCRELGIKLVDGLGEKVQSSPGTHAAPKSKKERGGRKRRRQAEVISPLAILALYVCCRETNLHLQDTSEHRGENMIECDRYAELSACSVLLRSWLINRIAKPNGTSTAACLTPRVAASFHLSSLFAVGLKPMKKPINK